MLNCRLLSAGAQRVPWPAALLPWPSRTPPLVAVIWGSGPPDIVAFLFSLPADGSRDPEALQPTFNALAAMMKHLARHLTTQVPAVLAQTARLRYSSAKHVRILAAKAVGFLLR